MSREGVTHDQLTRGEPSVELNNVVYEVASTAKVCLNMHRHHSSRSLSDLCMKRYFALLSVVCIVKNEDVSPAQMLTMSSAVTVS